MTVRIDTHRAIEAGGSLFASPPAETLGPAVA
jgi:hypothetical protein